MENVYNLFNFNNRQKLPQVILQKPMLLLWEKKYSLGVFDEFFLDYFKLTNFLVG